MVQQWSRSHTLYHMGQFMSHHLQITVLAHDLVQNSDKCTAAAADAAAKSLQLCPTLCDPIDALRNPFISLHFTVTLVPVTFISSLDQQTTIQLVFLFLSFPRGAFLTFHQKIIQKCPPQHIPLIKSSSGSRFGSLAWHGRPFWPRPCLSIPPVSPLSTLLQESLLPSS